MEGIDMVLFDLKIAGSVHTWPGNGGSLDAERHRILRDRLADLDQVHCLAALDQVLPLLDKAEDLRYGERLDHPRLRGKN